jgi:hypothetical protein
MLVMGNAPTNAPLILYYLVDGLSEGTGVCYQIGVVRYEEV